MKILFFSPYFHPYTSGITTYPKALFTELVKENLVTVLTFPHTTDLAHFETVDAIHIHRMPFVFKVSKGYISPQSLFYFWDETVRNDVVMLNIPNFEGLFLAVFAKLLRKKVVAIYHCQVFLGNSIWDRLVAGILNLSVGIQLRLSDFIVIYTKDYAERVGLWKQYQKKIILTLPPVPEPGFDSEYYKTLHKPSGSFYYIGYAGRIAREKGLENLIKATAQLSTPLKNVKILFAGPYGNDVAGEQAYYEKIIRFLKKYKVPYEFLGNLKGDKLGAFYQAIDVLVLPSINRTEAFGIVQAEAMMSGTPVIASNLPGVRVPVKTTEMGLIVKPGDVKGITEALETIRKKPSSFASAKKVQYAKETFRLEKTVQVYRELLQNIDGKKKKRGRKATRK